MRRVVLFVTTSLDGHIAGPQDELDWLFSDQDYGYAEFEASIDAIVMGRRSYDVCLGFPEYPYGGHEVIVFSRSREGSDEHARYTAESPAEVVRKLRAQPGKDIWLLGGGELVREFLAADLIDVYRIFVHPLVLGGGLPLFPAPTAAATLRLVSATPFSSGMVELHYERTGT